MPPDCSTAWLRGRMASSAPTTNRNDTALTMKAVAGPNRPSTRPPSAGPTARAAVNWIEFTRTALSSSGCGTSAGTNACHDVIITPTATLPTNRTATMLVGVAVSVTQRAQRARATRMPTKLVTIRIDLREKRSASAPDSGPMITDGKNETKAANPNQVVDLVIV